MPFAATGIVTAGSLLLGTKLAQDVLRSPKSRKGGRQKGGMADLEEAFKGSLGVDTPAPVAESFASGPVAPSGGMSIQDNSVSQSGGKHRKPRSKKSCGGNPPDMPPVMGGKPRKAAHKKAPATRRHRGGGKPCEDDEKFECDDDGTPVYINGNERKPYDSSSPKSEELFNKDDDFGFGDNLPKPYSTDTELSAAEPQSSDTAQLTPSISSDTAQLPKSGGSRNHRKHKKGGSDEQQQLLEQVNKLQQFIAQSAQSQKGGKKKAPKAKPVSPKRKPAAKKGPARKKVTVGGALQMYSQQLENLAKQINDMTRQ